MQKATVLHSFHGCDAQLLERDFTAIAPQIEAAFASAEPLLTHNPEFSLYGKRCRMRRAHGFFAKPADSHGYFFSGQLAASIEPPQAVAQLLALVNGTCGTRYNGVLVNRYADGDDYISDHRDDEKALDPTHGVLTLSYGAERTLLIKPWNPAQKAPSPKKDGGWVATRTREYHALQMAGADFQRRFTHGIPKERAAGVRFSATFRVHDRASEEKAARKLGERQKRKRAEEETDGPQFGPEDKPFRPDSAFSAEYRAGLKTLDEVLAEREAEQVGAPPTAHTATAVATRR